MAEVPTVDPGRDRSPRSSAVWFAFLGAPVAWLVHLAAASALVPVGCELGTEWLVHATTVVTAVAAVASIVVAHRRREEVTGASSFLVTSGFWLGILFLALILLEGLPVLFLETCG